MLINSETLNDNEAKDLARRQGWICRDLFGPQSKRVDGGQQFLWFPFFLCLQEETGPDGNAYVLIGSSPHFRLGND